MRKTREMETVLQQKGFQQDKTHHKMYWLYIAGQKTSVRTYFSHGLREYNRSLLGAIQRQLRLQTFGELDALFDCPMTGQQYASLMIQRNVVTLASAKPQLHVQQPKRKRR